MEPCLVKVIPQDYHLPFFKFCFLYFIAQISDIDIFLILKTRCLKITKYNSGIKKTYYPSLVKAFEIKLFNWCFCRQNNAWILNKAIGEKKKRSGEIFGRELSRMNSTYNFLESYIFDFLGKVTSMNV